MLEKLRSMLGSVPAKTRSERVATFGLDGKPITRAVLLRGAALQDDAILLARRLGNTKAFAEESSLGEFAASCASTIALTVSYDALKKNERPMFFPNEPVPKYAPIVVAFGIFILQSIHAHAEAEGVHFDFQRAAAQTASLFFIDHPAEERVKCAKLGLEAFESVANVDLPNVQEWRDTFFKMVPLYLLQLAKGNQGGKRMDLDSLFAAKMENLLRSVGECL